MCSSIGDRFFTYDAPRVRKAAGEIRFLANRSESDWVTLTQHTETRRYHAGQTILAAGERDQVLYLPTEGAVGVVLPNAPNAFKGIDAPSVFGEVAFIDANPRSVTIVALRDCELLRMSLEACVLSLLSIVFLLIVGPFDGLKLWWGPLVPSLPLVWFVAPWVVAKYLPLSDSQLAHASWQRSMHIKP